MSEYIWNPDVTKHRVGRCNVCPNRPKYAWRTGTLNLTEARCLKCDRLLDKTSRMAHGTFRWIEGEALDTQLRTAASKAYAQKLEYLSQALDADEAGETERAEKLRLWAASFGKTHERLAKAIRAEYWRNIQATDAVTALDKS